MKFLVLMSLPAMTLGSVLAGGWWHPQGGYWVVSFWYEWSINRHSNS